MNADGKGVASDALGHRVSPPSKRSQRGDFVGLACWIGLGNETSERREAIPLLFAVRRHFNGTLAWRRAVFKGSATLATFSVNERFIDTDAALGELARELMLAREIAFDVEADGLFRYRARLCTIQLATADFVAVVDTLSVQDVSVLAPVFQSDAILKVVHDASFDARMLRDVGLPLRNIFDTSIAVRFLGDAQAGLASVIEKRLGVVVSKEFQKDDWGRRPLSDAQRAYLLNDVRHLLPLAEIIREELQTKGIVDEANEEAAYLLHRVAVEQSEEEAPRPLWTRVKGATELREPSRAILRELCLAREAEAEARDVPSFKVIGNDSLLAIAKKRPKSMQDLVRVVGAGALRVHTFTTRILDAIKQGEALGDVPSEELAPPRPAGFTPEMRLLHKARDRALSNWRRTTATARSVDPQVVLPGHCLHDIVALGPTDVQALSSIPGLGNFRIVRDGAAIVAAIQSADLQPA